MMAMGMYLASELYWLNGTKTILGGGKCLKFRVHLLITLLATSLELNKVLFTNLLTYKMTVYSL